MAEEHVRDEDFGDDDAGGSGVVDCPTIPLEDCPQLTVPKPIVASHCRKGVHAMLKDNPCKIQELKISKTGKHGSSKAAMFGYDLVTGRKYQVTCPGHTNMLEFEPKKVEYEVVSIEGDKITAIDGTGGEKEFKVPSQEHGAKLVAEFQAIQAAITKAQNDNADLPEARFLVITVLYCPRGNEKKWMANMWVESFKEGKDME